MKKTFKLSALCLTSLLASNIALADENIAVINAEEVFKNHPRREIVIQKLEASLKAPTEKLQAEEKQLIATRDKLSQEVQNKVKALEKDATKLTQAQIKQRQAEITKFAQAKEAEFNKLSQAFQDKATKFQNENQQKLADANFALIQEIKNATTEVAKAKRYTLVIDEKAAFYTQEGKNITQEVIKALKEKYGKK